jgi:hypothetical protein
MGNTKPQQKSLGIGWSVASEAIDAINLLYSGQFLFYLVSVYLLFSIYLVRGAGKNSHPSRTYVSHCLRRWDIGILLNFFSFLTLYCASFRCNELCHQLTLKPVYINTRKTNKAVICLFLIFDFF